VRQLARSVGVDEFLIKPVDRLELTACIRNLACSRNRSQETQSQPEAVDGIDTAALATILAERDRARASNAPVDSTPATSDEAAHEEQSAPAQPSDDVLILDDEHISRTVLDTFVRRLNCYPVRFADPCEALEWSETHTPLAAIVDYMLPDIDGLEFTRRFRALLGKADVPVLMVSAYGDSLLNQAALAAGVNAFLHKPVDAADLMAHLRTILAARALHRRLAKHERVWRTTSGNQRSPGATG
jgi:CheY-like chemotaxis protein